VSAEAPHLLRFTRVLEERGIAIEPALSIATACPTESVFLGVGTLTDCIQLLVPSRAEALKIVAPGAALPTRSMLLVSAHRAAPLGAGAVIGGPTTAPQAVDEVGPPAARPLWLPIIESLASLAGSAIKNRTRYLTEERGTVTVMFPQRGGAEEAAFGAALAAVANRLGVPATWRRVYDEAGAGIEVGVTTECTASGPLARMALRFGYASWDRAIDLAKALVDVDRARDAAVRMGTLAGGLEIETLRGVDAVIDASAPDLVVWLRLPPFGERTGKRAAEAPKLDLERVSRALHSGEIREKELDSYDAPALFLRRAGAFFRPRYDEIDYTDWNGAIVGSGPGSILRDAIPPDPELRYEDLAPLLDLGQFARELVARHPSTPPEVLARLAGDDEIDVQNAVLERSDKGKDAEVRLAASRFVGIRDSLARKPGLAPEAIEVLAKDTTAEVRSYLLQRDDLTPAALATLETDPREWMRARVKAWRKARGR
jgi:leucine rich repeat (LRR) protein